MTATHGTAADLLRTICEYPADDAPRLVLADFLEGQGDVRGEFIRVQIQLASLRCHQPPSASEQLPRTYDSLWCNDSLCEHCHGERASALRRREQELFGEHAGPGQVEWLSQALHDMLPCGMEIASLLPWFRRGFVAEVHTTAAAWLLHGPRIVGACPVESVMFGNRQPQRYPDGGNTVPEFGWFRGIRGADEMFSTPPEWWEIMSAMPHCKVHGRWADFPSESSATEADHAAALAHARLAAGLP